jgi:hypothetical protein
MTPQSAAVAALLPLVATPEAATPLDPASVTPGVGGFVVFIALALASWVLYRSLATHLRRVDVRARLRAEEEARTEGASAGPPRDEQQ